MTRAQARTFVQAHTKRPNTTVLDTETLINQAINLARTEIQQIHDFRRQKVTAELSSVPADQNTITLPSDYFRVLSPITLIDTVEATITYNIKLKPKSWVKSRYPNWANLPSGGVSVAFVDYEADEIVLVPPPIQAWNAQFEYFAEVAEFTADNDVIERGTENAVVAWATSYLFKSTQQLKDAVFWNAEYLQALRVAVSSDNRDRDDMQMREFSQDEDLQNTVPPWLDPFNGIPHG